MKIGDFGLATEGGAARTVDARAAMSVSRGQNAEEEDDDMTKGVGTPFYISPEQLKGPLSLCVRWRFFFFFFDGRK